MLQKKLILPLFCALLAACGEAASNTNAPPKPTPSNTPVVTTSNTQSSNTETSNTQTSNSSGIKNGDKTPTGANSTNKPPPTPVATASPATTEKKDEGLFSFPPPRVTSVAEMKTDALRSTGAETTLGDVSRKLAEALEKADYKRGKYKYFWNDREEFAVVTAMERVDASGAKLPEAERWVDDEHLPRARSIGDYFNYLIYGKKSFYRVFAFIVTARRDAADFGDGTPPDFEMAKNWHNKGKSKLGAGESDPGKVESVVFGEKYNCFALLYLFVNHTSLDRAKSIDALDDDQKWLGQELVKDAETHLEKTAIHF